MKEIKEVQALRYQVFFKEKRAKPSFRQKVFKRDFDLHDNIADHLIVIDKSKSDKIIGTYRLLRGTTAKINFGYYSENEFDLTNIKKIFSSKYILELGRSCVNSNYRTGLILKLLWYGIAKYIDVYQIKLLFGCVSFHGVNIRDIKEEIFFLRENFSLPKQIEIKSLQKSTVINEDKNLKRNVVLNDLPPLIKGYLRAGAMISQEYFVDYDFNTIDLFALVFTENINHKYKKKILH